MSKPGRLLIRTFPPNRNPNPGGILQAWALQRVLSTFGADVVTDGTKTNQRSRPPVPSRYQRLQRKISARLRPGLDKDRKAALAKVNSRVLSFARREIEQRPLYSGRAADSELVAWPDAFIAGSDQVWNPVYCDVPSFLFDFVGEDDPRPRVVYAASFGSDNPPFDPALIAETAPLASRLNAVSVREESAVRLCREYWGIEAVRVVDPTMLLEPSAYRAVYEANTDADLPSGGLAVYLLDRTPAKQSAARLLSTVYGTEKALWADEPPGTAATRSHPAEYSRPTVEEWLSSIAMSNAVLTDSYHGAIFSILFNRPFLVFPNPKRGVARFDTLLGVFGLQDRIARGDSHDIDRMAAPIDWTRVNALIADERERGIAFLRDALAQVLRVESAPAVDITAGGGE
ncbi:polysaccharide pyruvyl transferase family protein [Microbacterium sp. NPDC056044]|uniref:polysaccharide pyruvyl transferase family protein n=1 Tax=Microbacterium sp. NPDC056044 TaxID=3345690 RepID=UPI0035E156EC